MNSKSIANMVISLTLTDDRHSMTQLAVPLLVHGCFVIRSQIEKNSNGKPAYGDGVDFSRTLLSGLLVLMRYPIDVVFHGQARRLARCGGFSTTPR